MRERRPHHAPASISNAKTADNRAYFTSFYKSTVRDAAPQDRHTIPGMTEVESRFHYNATENSIIRALLRREPLPVGAETWHFLQKRKEWSVLDIGSGTGHWIDFYRDVFFAAYVTGVEIVPAMAEHLRKKYASQSGVEIIEGDISAPSYAFARQFDIVNAIGVMFHIVDDAAFARAMENLTKATKSGGLLLIGGDFGAETYNRQFHKVDNFESWQDHDKNEQQDNIVNKRVRSLSDWHDIANRCGLKIVDLVRSDSSQNITTPENDLLVLRKPE